MSLPMQFRQSPDPLENRLVDRLVDGELSDVERRELLLQLQNEPDGWRCCALAFLEAQNWRAALAPLASPSPVVARPMMIVDDVRRKRTSWRPSARLSGLAAGLAAAFALGWAFRGGPEETVPSNPVAQKAVSVPAGSSEAPQPAPITVATRESEPQSKPAQSAAPFDPVVKRWEQRGYRAETQKRLVALELKDGRKLNVPIHEVRLHYIGGQTY